MMNLSEDIGMSYEYLRHIVSRGGKKNWIYVKFLDTIFCQNLPYLNLFQFPFDKHKYFYYSIVV